MTKRELLEGIKSFLSIVKGADEEEEEKIKGKLMIAGAAKKSKDGEYKVKCSRCDGEVWLGKKTYKLLKKRKGKAICSYCLTKEMLETVEAGEKLDVRMFKDAKEEVEHKVDKELEDELDREEIYEGG